MILQRILQEIIKKIILLGTSYAWSMIRLSLRPSNVAYHIVNWRILVVSKDTSFLECKQNNYTPNLIPWFDTSVTLEKKKGGNKREKEEKKNHHHHRHFPLYMHKRFGLMDIILTSWYLWELDDCSRGVRKKSQETPNKVFKNGY